MRLFTLLNQTPRWCNSFGPILNNKIQAGVLVFLER